MKVKTNALSVKSIKDITNIIRDKFNLNLLDSFPILEVLEKMCDEGLLTIQVLSDDDSFLDYNTKAIYNTYDNFIYIKESTLYDIENNEYRSNFTLAHELFHYIQIQLYKFNTEMVEECFPYEEIDWQANEFAGELLLPIEALENKDDDYLSEYYKVSKECVLTRRVNKLKREKRLKEKENNNK